MAITFTITVSTSGCGIAVPGSQQICEEKKREGEREGKMRRYLRRVKQEDGNTLSLSLSQNETYVLSQQRKFCFADSVSFYPHP